MFQNTDVFTDEFIIDELLDFFFAAMVTTQYTTQTMVSHFIKDKESLKRVRNEFNDKLSEDIKNYCMQDGKIETEKMLKDLCIIDNCQDLDYLSRVIYEVLRFGSPTVATTNFTVQQDFTSGKFGFKKGDLIQIFIKSLHTNSNEW